MDFVSFATELNKNPSTKENATNETAPPGRLLLKTIWGAKCEVAKPNEESITYQFEFASSILKMFPAIKFLLPLHL